MKKLLIALAVAASAVGLQAATINWGGAIANADCTDTLSYGTTAYLVWSATDFSPATASTFNASDANWKNWTTDNGGTAVAKYALSDADVDAWSFSSTYAPTTAASYNGYYAVLVIDGGDATKASYMYAGSFSNATDGNIGTLSPASIVLNEGWATDPGPWLNSGGFNTTVSSVPEPTSGLLLILGMAGLALKRKRA